MKGQKNLEQENKYLKDLLKNICDDAYGDINYPNKRIWAVRASLLRKIIKAIDYKYDSERAMSNQSINRNSK